jgi:RNA polymerase sigma factor (sigma-70 family)
LENKELIRLCLLEDNEGQRLLYEKYITPMCRLCLRYIKDKEEVKDVVAEGFIRIFEHLKKFEYRGEQSLEVWIRRIMINECLMYLRKRKGHLFVDYPEATAEPSQPDNIDGKAKEIFRLIQTLPEGYRTIFNLFVIDGYSHKEIAAMLGISESASRSQLTHARNKLQSLLTAYGWK